MSHNQNTATPAPKPEPLMQDRLARELGRLVRVALIMRNCGELPESIRATLLAPTADALVVLDEYSATETRGTRIKSLRDFLHTLDEKLSAIESKPYLDPDDGREWRNLRRQRREAEARLDAMAA